MAKGENIFRRRDGRWEARYIKGRELSGKIKYGYCYGKTYREAKEKAAKRKAALENGALLPTATTQKPFSSYCLEWLHTKKCTVKESTYIKYSTVVNKHIMPKLGECCPLGFTTELMDDFIKELQFEDELAPKTVHDILVVLHGILKFASSKFAGSFPAVEINYPKIGKKEMRVLSREEQARLVAYLNEDLDSCRFGILLALCTGIRIGELCALQWESVSTNDKAIRIAKTLQRLHDTSVSQGARTRIVIGPPKSDTSVRTIPMTEYVTGLCRRMKPQSSAAYVLTGTEAFMEPRTLQYRLEKYTQACGLEGVHFHTLRHTFATRAVEVGFEVKSLSEILGHASVTITLDRYVHASLELKRDNMQKLKVVIGDMLPECSDDFVGKAGVLNLRHHFDGAAETGPLFCGLKNQQNVRRELVRVFLEDLCRAEQHGGVPVVPAGVHFAGDLGAVGEAGLFLQRERVHICPQGDDPVVVLPTDESQNAELRREDRNVLPLEEGLYQLFRFSGVKSGFGMLMERAAQFNDLRQNLGGARLHGGVQGGVECFVHDAASHLTQ